MALSWTNALIAAGSALGGALALVLAAHVAFRLLARRWPPGAALSDSARVPFRALALVLLGRDVLGVDVVVGVDRLVVVPPGRDQLGQGQLVVDTADADRGQAQLAVVAVGLHAAHRDGLRAAGLVEHVDGRAGGVGRVGQVGEERGHEQREHQRDRQEPGEGALRHALTLSSRATRDGPGPAQVRRERRTAMPVLRSRSGRAAA